MTNIISRTLLKGALISFLIFMLISYMDSNIAKAIECCSADTWIF